MDETKTTEETKEKITNTETKDELLQRIAEQTKKQVFYARISAICCGILAIAVVITLLILVPSLLKTIHQVNGVVTEAEETLVQAQEALDGVGEMTDAVTSMSENMDTFVSENVVSIEQVMKKLEAIDFEGLNGATKDLGDVVEPMAKFFGKFKK